MASENTDAGVRSIFGNMPESIPEALKARYNDEKPVTMELSTLGGSFVNCKVCGQETPNRWEIPDFGTLDGWKPVCFNCHKHYEQCNQLLKAVICGDEESESRA